ncbi:MAG: hypothetical protein ACK55I_42325, partial [bacterium]
EEHIAGLIHREFDASVARKRTRAADGGAGAIAHEHLREVDAGEESERAVACGGAVGCEGDEGEVGCLDVAADRRRRGAFVDHDRGTLGADGSERVVRRGQE